jgi:hypothetical protein
MTRILCGALSNSTNFIYRNGTSKKCDEHCVATIFFSSPESVKTRNDVFYLQPERSCVPDSPVWYSTTALPQEALEKMLHRVKMVKEINVALLTS